MPIASRQLLRFTVYVFTLFSKDLGTANLHFPVRAQNSPFGQAA